MLLNSKPQSPAAFAEQYILESIWQNHFAPGTILPAERELSELIGVTRTTLREVLQRLARDGWLTIQHGKPTKVNDYWETGGLGILDTLARLDVDDSLDLVEILEQAQNLENNAQAYVDYDWRYLHKLSRASNNPIFTLLLNGFKTLYLRVGKYYYSEADTRQLAAEYYQQQLKLINEQQDIEQIINHLRQYGREGGQHYQNLREQMPALSSLGDKVR
jgi:GntR family transcriptional regulator, negative regulator for fad regulon and positive regulator of fabA